MKDPDDELLAALDALRARNLEWIQLDVTAAVTAAELGAALAPLWRMFGPRRWWFVRKAPGMRVRVELDGAEPDALLRAFRTALDPLQPVGVTVYEPEVYRFGGTSGMDVAHDHFAFDTALAVLFARGRGLQLTPVEWSAAALGDLSTRVVDDSAERWDAWKKLEELLASVGAPPAPQPRAGMGETAIPLHLATALQAGNERVAVRLRQAALAHGVGRRTWFAAVAVFHWNRLGLDPPQMAQVVASVLDQGSQPR